MEVTSGVRSFLKASWAHELLQWFVGANAAQAWLATNAWKVRDGQTIVDAGCGPGALLLQLPKDVNYFGFDVSEAYIRTARANYSDRGEFVCGCAVEFLDRHRELEGTVDLVLASGVLHHLDDDVALELLQVAHQLLKPGGRFVSIDPTYLRHQQWSSRWIISKDRGQSVRQEQQWKELVNSVFTDYETSITTGLLRIPYTHIIIEAKK